MRISFSKLVVILILTSAISLLFSSSEEAKRNLDLGYYLISEYLYTELLETGDLREEVLVGLSLSLINQNKYSQIIELADKYPSSHAIYQRNIAYAYFQQTDYQASYYYYDQALKQDNASLIDLSGRAWSAFYLGKASLAYEDFKLVNASEYQNSAYDGLSFIEDNRKSNYGEIFTVFSDKTTNLNLHYGYHYYNFSAGINYNHNKSNNSKREMITLQTGYESGKFSYDFASMNARGDYHKLYDAYGLALKSSYLIMFKDFQSTISLLGGYSYYESVSAQQLRADIKFNTQKYGISSGVSYLYLDFITPHYDQQELLFHSSLFYHIIPSLTLDYTLNLGKGNFAYNENLMPYDDYDLDKLWHSAGITYNLKELSLYLKYMNKDFAENSIGTGISYVF